MRLSFLIDSLDGQFDESLPLVENQSDFVLAAIQSLLGPSSYQGSSCAFGGLAEKKINKSSIDYFS